MKYVLALDQGTTSSRAILFDEAGALVSVAQREFRQIFPQPGWVEHDPVEIFRTQRDVAREALRRMDISMKDVMGVGIANQRETTIVWDRQSGEPIHNAIVWQDRRTAEWCRRMANKVGDDELGNRTGLLFDAYFSGSKIAWLLDNVAGARAAAAAGKLAFGTIDTFLLWRLTGGKVHASDATNASRSLLLDIHKGTWDEDLLKLLGVPAPLLPKVVD